MTAPAVCLPRRGWQVSVLVWSGGGDGSLVGGLIVVGLAAVVMEGDGTRDGVGGGGWC